MKSVALFDIDCSISNRIAREVLTGNFRETFKRVIGFTHSIAHSGDLCGHGIELHSIQPEMEVKILEEKLKGIDIVVLTPDVTSDLMYQESISIIRAAKLAAISHFVLVSVIWKGEGVRTEERFRMIEETLVASHSRWTIIRAGYIQNNFGYWNKEIMEHGQITIPFNKDEAEKMNIAPINLYDLGQLVVKILTMTDQFVRQKILEITGNELLSLNDIVEIISKSAGKKISIKHIDMKDMEVKLRTEKLGLSAIQHILDGFEMWKKGKLSQISKDFENVMKRKQISFEEYVKENIFRY